VVEVEEEVNHIMVSLIIVVLICDEKRHRLTRRIQILSFMKRVSKFSVLIITYFCTKQQSARCSWLSFRRPKSEHHNTHLFLLYSMRHSPGEVN
jgi:hypothetical protein